MLELPYWFQEHGEWVALFAGLSLAILIGSAALMPWFVGRLPVDYFVRKRRIRDETLLRNIAIRVGRNLLGLLLILVGIAMLVLPGQGLLTILAGILLADVPGKRRAALWLLRRPSVSKAVTWLRTRAGQPPFQLPTPSNPGEQSGSG